MVYFAEAPSATLCVDGLLVMPKSAAATTAAAPVPVKADVSGEPDALSATLSVAVAAPVAVGAKTTAMVHLAPAASELPQVFVVLNTVASVPVSLIPVIDNAALPVLVRVAVCDELLLPSVTEPKVRVAGVSIAAGAVNRNCSCAAEAGGLCPRIIGYGEDRVLQSSSRRSERDRVGAVAAPAAVSLRRSYWRW